MYFSYVFLVKFWSFETYFVHEKEWRPVGSLGPVDLRRFQI